MTKWRFFLKHLVKGSWIFFLKPVQDHSAIKYRDTAPMFFYYLIIINFKTTSQNLISWPGQPNKTLMTSRIFSLMFTFYNQFRGCHANKAIMPFTCVCSKIFFIQLHHKSKAYCLNTTSVNGVLDFWCKL